MLQAVANQFMLLNSLDFFQWIDIIRCGAPESKISPASIAEVWYPEITVLNAIEQNVNNDHVGFNNK